MIEIKRRTKNKRLGLETPEKNHALSITQKHVSDDF